MPYYVQLPDGRDVEFPDGFPRDQAMARVRSMLGQADQVAPAQEAPASTNILRDVPASVVSGVGNIATGLGGIAGLATGDYDNFLTRTGQGISGFARNRIASEGLRQRQDAFQQRMEAVQDQGLGTQALTAAGELLSNPYLLATQAIEQVPQLAASLGVGRAGLAAGQIAARRAGMEAGSVAAQQAARRGALAGAVGTGTALQTGDVADQTYRDVMDTPQEVLERSPEYQELRRVMSDQDAREALAVRASREAALIAAPASAASAALLPGVERMAFGQQARRALLGRALTGFAAEGTQEAIEEGSARFAQNVGASVADVDRSLTQGVGGALAQGMILGGIMGGGMGAITGRSPDPIEAQGEDPTLGVAVRGFMQNRPSEQDEILAQQFRVVSLAFPNVAQADFAGTSPEARDRIYSAAVERLSVPRQPEQTELPQQLALPAPQQPQSAGLLAAPDPSSPTPFQPAVIDEDAPAVLMGGREVRPSQYTPLIEGFLDNHAQQQGGRNISIPAFQRYMSARTGTPISLEQARGLFDRYFEDTQGDTGLGYRLTRQGGEPINTAEGIKTQGGIYRIAMPQGPKIGPMPQAQEAQAAQQPTVEQAQAEEAQAPKSMAELRGRAATQPGQQAAPQPANPETFARAREVINDRLASIRNRGAQGEQVARGLEEALKNRSLNEGQIYAAFLAADTISNILPAGANHQIRFVPKIIPQAGAGISQSGGVAGEEVQGFRVRPKDSASAGLIELSLSDVQIGKLRETAAHEAFHVLQDYYRQYDPQLSKLMDASFAKNLDKDGKMSLNDIDPTLRRKLQTTRMPRQGRGGPDVSYWQFLTSSVKGRVSPREAQAYVFGSLYDAAKRGVPMSGLKPSFARFVNFLRQFFQRMGNALRGDGFRDVSDLMGSAVEGDARRFDERGTPTAQDMRASSPQASARAEPEFSAARFTDEQRERLREIDGNYEAGLITESERDRATREAGITRFDVIDTQNGNFIGSYVTRKLADQAADRRDRQYGAQRYRVVPIDFEEPEFSARSAPVRRGKKPQAGSNPFPTPPADEVQARLRRMQKRRQSYLPGISNGPRNSRAELLDEDGNLAWAVGKITFDDWIARVEANLNAREIKEARDWYPQAMQAYSQYFGKDWPSYLAAWLMANQQASPATAQMNAIRAREKVLSGSQGGPKAGLAEERLLPFWQAIERGGGLPTGGAQKLYDFIDSGLLRSTRKWMGDDPAAGAPAVADVHSLRDVGFVDETLRDELVRKFGAQMNKIPVDISGSPGEAQYEMAADFMREVTDHLNRIKYRGGNWTPYEVQAVGWMSTTKFMGNPGQTPFEAILYNIRDLNYELGFGEGAPYNEQFPLLARLPTQGQKEVSQKILNDVTDFARDMAGVKEFTRVHATGGWLSDNVAPNARFQAIASPEAMVDMANIIGYLTQQTGMLPYRLLPTETVKSKLALRIYPKSDNALATDENMSTLWQKLRKAGIKKSGAKNAPDLIQGFSTHEADGKAAMLLMFDGKGERLLNRLREGDVLQAIQRAADDMGIDLDVDVVYHESDYQQNDWRSQPDGEGYLQGLRSRFGSDVQARLRDYQRRELEPRLEAAIREAVERYGVRDDAEFSARASDPASAGSEAREFRDAGGVRGGRGLLAASGGTGDEAPLEGLPRRVKAPGIGVIEAGPFLPARRTAEQYMREAGLPYNPPTKYVRVDPERAARIADAFEAMENNPSDPLVRASYEAMARETLAQWEAIKRTGFRAEFFPEDGSDPYSGSPRLAIEDVRNNNHMYVFPTETGYGQAGITDEERRVNPMLRDTGERWNGRPVLVNDVFRAVHDYFGHAKEGVGFRADGEENAWRSHAAMYSPLARLAMTTETRGQNSWLNYGPVGEANRTAKVEDTVFAEQKLGVLPSWVHRDGAEDFLDAVDVDAMRQQIADGGLTDDQVEYSARATNTSAPEFLNWWNGGWRGDGQQVGPSVTVNADGSPTVFYHGTQQSFERFGRARSGSFGGEGPFFFSSNPRFAEDYAMSALYAGAEGREVRSGQRMLPVYLSAQNPFDSDNRQRKQELLDYVDKALDDETISWRDLVNDETRERYEDQISSGRATEGQIARRSFKNFREILMDDWQNWAAVETRAAQRYIREQGYDSFFLIEDGEKNLAVYDPRQVKSIFNRFDVGASMQPEFSARSFSDDPSLASLEERITGKNLAQPGVFTRGLRSFVGAMDSTGLRGADTKESLADALIRTTVNRAHPLWLLDKLAEERSGLTLQSAGMAMEMALNNSGRVQMLMQFGPLAYDPATGNVTVRDDVSGLVDAIKGRLNDQDTGKAQTYLAMLRERDLRRVGRRGFVNVSDAEINDAIRKYERDFPQWRDMAADLQKINEALLDFAVSTGTLDRSKAQELAQLFYTPFYRQMEEDGQTNPDEIQGPRISDAMTNLRTAFDKKLEGGEAALGDLFENIIRNADAIMKAGMKNVAMITAAENMELAGLGRISPRKIPKKTITFKVNGKNVHFEVDDPVLFTALAGAPRHVQSGILEAMSRMAGFFRDMVTVAPSFMLANLWRGKLMAYVQEGASLSPVSTGKGLRDALKASASYRAIAAQTGFSAGAYGMGEGDSAQALRDEIYGTGYTPRGLFEKFMRPLRKASEATEMAERIALYERLKAKGVPEKQASFQAYMLAPFSRRGMGGGFLGETMNFLVPLVPFLNAKVQGMYRLFENEKGSKRTLGFPREIFLRGLVLMAATIALAGYNMEMEEDRWDDESPDLKFRYDIIYLPNDKKILMPRAFEVGSWFGALPVFLLDAIRKEDGGDLAKILTDLGTSTFFFNPIPQAAIPILGAATNYDFFRGRSLEDRGIQSFPVEERANRSTSSIAKAIGETVGISPIRVQYILDGYLGTMGTNIMAGFDSALAATGAIPSKPAGAFGDPMSMPAIVAGLTGASRFYRSEDQTASRFVGDFYKIKEQTDQLTRSMNRARQIGDMDRIRELQAEEGLPLRMRPMVNAASQQLSDINARIRRIEQMDISSEEKTERIRPLRERRDQITQRVVERARQLGI